MVTIDIVYEGDLRCRAQHGPSSQELFTDPPVDNEGRGESYSPTDLVATALGTCMLSIMGIVARRHEWDLVGTTVRVEKSMRADPRRIARLDVAIRVPRDFADDVKEMLEDAARSCPVAQSIHPDIDVPLSFEWGVERQPSESR